MITVYIDGLAEPLNPGIAAYGYVAYEDDRRLFYGYGGIGEQTNNYAEYTALIKALEELLGRGLGAVRIVVKSDSQLLVRQLNGLYAVRSPNITPLYSKARLMIKRFRNISILWVPREENLEADSMSRMGYEDYLDEHPELFEAYKKWFATEKQKSSWIG